MPNYKTYYWNNIDVKFEDYFVGSTNLLDDDNNIVGALLLSLAADGNDADRVVKEDFCFIFDNGSVNFSIGFNSKTFSTISNGNYGIVSNKSGIYTDIEKITYFFEFSKEKKLWKITFRY